MPSTRAVLFTSVVVAAASIAALPWDSTVAARGPASAVTSVELRTAGNTALSKRVEPPHPNAQYAAFSAGQAIALGGVAATTCSSSSIIAPYLAMPICVVALAGLVINVFLQTVGMILSGTGTSKRDFAQIDGPASPITYYYNHTADGMSFRQQIKRAYDAGDGYPVSVGHLTCDDGSLCQKAWYSYSDRNVNGTMKTTHRIHGTPGDFDFSSSSTKTGSALYPRQSTYGVGGDGYDSDNNPHLFGGYIWEDEDVNTLTALHAEDGQTAANNIIEQMNDEFVNDNGFFGNTGVYCMGMKSTASSDDATEGYLWYYNSLSEYTAMDESYYMQQCLA